MLQVAAAVVPAAGRVDGRGRRARRGNTFVVAGRQRRADACAPADHACVDHGGDVRKTTVVFRGVRVLTTLVLPIFAKFLRVSHGGGALSVSAYAAFRRGRMARRARVLQNAPKLARAMHPPGIAFQP
ncbi:MAG TPA: hypothetical protein VGN52_20080 [Burkholderiales bacterium]|jgi:hypothetical protein